jgi:hypothetical protein
MSPWRGSPPSQCVLTVLTAGAALAAPHRDATLQPGHHPDDSAQYPGGERLGGKGRDPQAAEGPPIK